MHTDEGCDPSGKLIYCVASDMHLSVQASVNWDRDGSIAV
jgi:hypothetical protein